jgi:hypothetical protein
VRSDKPLFWKIKVKTLSNDNLLLDTVYDCRYTQPFFGTVLPSSSWWEIFLFVKSEVVLERRLVCYIGRLQGIWLIKKRNERYISKVPFTLNKTCICDNRLQHDHAKNLSQDDKYLSKIPFVVTKILCCKPRNEFNVQEWLNGLRDVDLSEQTASLRPYLSLWLVDWQLVELELRAFLIQGWMGVRYQLPSSTGNRDSVPLMVSGAC